MRMKVKDVDISTGGIAVAIINSIDAEKLGTFKGDRVCITKGKKSAVTIVDIAESSKVVPVGTVALFEEAISQIECGEKDYIEVTLEKKPDSVALIKKKMDGKRLAYHEIYEIVKDIVDNKLTDAEIAYFVCACYIHSLDLNEIINLTRAMFDTGDILRLEPPVFDVHCIGGVAGNRTTPIIVPIVAAAGLIIPKTSSRAITSPAGTADTMEVIAPVSFNISQIAEIVKKTNGCLVWGGAVSLAPADDRIIKIEYPMGIDAQAQLLASVIAKKKSVSATHVLIDIPVGRGSKMQDMRLAKNLKKQFMRIGARMGMHFDVIITDGCQPIGNGFGAVLEMRDILRVLKNSPLAPLDLREKSLYMAGLILEMGGKARRGQGKAMAKHMLETGVALKKFTEIIEAQGGKVPDEDKIEAGKLTHVFPAYASGKIEHIDSTLIAQICRAAGTPRDKRAGLYLNKHKHEKVIVGEPLFTVYSDSKQKMQYAIELVNKLGFDAIIIR